MSDRIKCEICEKSFNPSSYVRHECVKQPAATQMLTRKMQDLMAKKKKLALIFPVDTTRSGVFPEPANESVEERMEHIRSMVRHLNELKLARLPSIVNAVRSALTSKRLKGEAQQVWAISELELLRPGQKQKDATKKAGS